MTLNNQQIKMLLKLVVEVSDDCVDCDFCATHIAEYAELHLTGQSLTAALIQVETHLHNCCCCQTEFSELLQALLLLESAETTKVQKPS